MTAETGEGHNSAGPEGRPFRTPSRAPLGIGDREVPVPSHICLFYDDDAELRERLPFLTLGLRDPAEVCVLFGKHQRLAEIVGYLLEDSGEDIEGAIAAKRLVLIEGASTGEATLAHIGNTLDEIVAGGARLIRFLGFIAWGDPSWPPEEDLLAFEAKVNLAVLKYPAVIVCSYKLGVLPGPVLIHSGIETHPITVLGGRVCDNPQYVHPDEYLVRLAQLGRTGSRDAAAVQLSSLTDEELDEIVRGALRRPSDTHARRG